MKRPAHQSSPVYLKQVTHRETWRLKITDSLALLKVRTSSAQPCETETETERERERERVKER